MIKLYQHQKEGRDFLLKHKKACLFFEVGTGKTFTALSAITSLPPAKVLIVAPKRVLEMVWKTDTNYDLSAYDVTYINYEKISRDKDFSKNRYDYIILDEVHKLKGRTSKCSRRLRLVCSRASYVFGLTGTPIANSYLDVYCIYHNMSIPEFYENYNEFMYTYYVTKNLKSSMGFDFALPLYPKKERLNELLNRIDRHSITKLSKDCIDLPDKIIETVYVDGMVSKEYKEVMQGILRLPYYTKTILPLESINKARQASNGFLYGEFDDVIRFRNNKKFDELTNYLEDLLEETDKVIIVYYYKEDLEQLKTLEYDWTTDPSEFENKQILFLQFGQAEGLNLQYCHSMIFYTYDYSFLKFDQMCGRIYRNGQTHLTKFIIFINKGTIEEKVWWSIKNKKSIDEFFKEVLTSGR